MWCWLWFSPYLPVLPGLIALLSEDLLLSTMRLLQTRVTLTRGKRTTLSENGLRTHGCPKTKQVFSPMFLLKVLFLQSILVQHVTCTWQWFKWPVFLWMTMVKLVWNVMNMYTYWDALCRIGHYQMKYFVATGLEWQHKELKHNYSTESSSGTLTDLVSVIVTHFVPQSKRR